MAKKEEKQIAFPDEYYVLGADLSLKRPGFCLLRVQKENGENKITDVQLSSVDNKTDKKKSHGELLNDIKNAYLNLTYPFLKNFYAVRETEIMFQKVPSERSLSKVVGIMDWMHWNMYGQDWYSIYPTTIKKIITGSGKAEKKEVAENLEKYIGKQTYKCDDESDAAAVAVAWLIQQGQIKEKTDE